MGGKLSEAESEGGRGGGDRVHVGGACLVVVGERRERG